MINDVARDVIDRFSVDLAPGKANPARFQETRMNGWIELRSVVCLGAGDGGDYNRVFIRAGDITSISEQYDTAFVPGQITIIGCDGCLLRVVETVDTVLTKIMEASK